MTKTLYIMCGVGFAGKSTLAKKIAERKNASLVNQDDIYFQMEAGLDPSLNDEQEWELIRKVALTRIAEELKSGRSVVYDSTNTRLEHRERARQLAKENQAEVVVVFVDTPSTVLVERQMRNKDTKERHDVEQQYLDQAHRELEKPQADEHAFIFTPDTELEDWLNKLP